LSPQLNDINMIMKCVVYKNGVSQGDLQVEDISEAIKLPDTFVWLGLREVDNELLDLIQLEFSLHELAVEDARSAHQRPKSKNTASPCFWCCIQWI